MNSNLQNKLQQFSATPPAGAWDKIADALEAGDAAYAKRLYNYEETPPAKLWTEIETNLAAPAPAKVVPLTTRFRTPLRYMAVASMIAVVLITATLLMKRTEAGALQAGSNTTVPESKPATVVTTTDKPGINTKTGTAAQQQPDVVKKEATNEEASAAKKDRSVAVNDDRKTAKAGGTKTAYAGLHQYVLFSDGDGKLRRVSKKLADLVTCKDGDANCQQRLRQLRQKMATSTMTTDFTGILEMLRQLQ